MDLSRIRTNRNAVVSVHFGREQITTNIWWEYGWYAITDTAVISILKQIKSYERVCQYVRVEELVNKLRHDYNPNSIGTPYRRDRASHSNLGRRNQTRTTTQIPAQNTTNGTLWINDLDETKLSGENLSYNDLLQINAMKEQTFGIEIEMSNISRERAARVAAEFFETNASHEPEYGHNAWVCRDRQGRVWKFQEDGSLYGTSAEMTSPILNYSDIETLQELIRRLRRAGAKSSVRYNCGVHVHVGAQGHTPQTLKNLANIMYKFEPLLDKAVAVSNGRHDYCKRMSENFIRALNRATLSNATQLTSASQANRSEDFVKFADIWYGGNGTSRGGHYNSSRYHITNFHSVFDHGTVEFRLFEFKEPDAERQNGLHAGEAKAFVQMCLALNQLAKTIGPIANVEQIGNNEKELMTKWFDKLCMCGDDFATAREYYTRRLS